MDVLLSTTYFGPVQWYQKLYRAEHVIIEQWESFQKQTYRNRCLIATTQGIQALTIPIVRPAGMIPPTSASSIPAMSSSLIKDIRISDHGNWRHLHWNALQSAYGESPFFEYYQDDIRPFFENRWTYLLDFNEEIRHKMCELLDILPTVSYSNQFMPPSPLKNPNSTLSDTHCQSYTPCDFRSAINPKRSTPDSDFSPKPYYQVYQQKHGFLPNLSIVDLLFNMGPESIFYL